MRRLQKILGTIAFLVVATAVVSYLYMDGRAKAEMQRELGAAPAGWLDSIRTFGRLPDLGGLTADRPDSGDGAAFGYDTTVRWAAPESLFITFARFFDDSAATPADSARWRAVAADTALDAVAALARRREWRALERAQAATSRDSTFLALAIPRRAQTQDAQRGLLLRAMWRLNRRDAAGARADVAGVMSMGEQMVRHEPTLFGVAIGRTLIAGAAQGYQRIALATRDTALHARVTALRSWASSRSGLRLSTYLEFDAQAAVDIARDSTLALGVRGDALMWVGLAGYRRPRFALRGPTGEQRAELRARTADPDPDIAQLATFIQADIDRLTWRERLQLLGGVPR